MRLPGHVPAGASSDALQSLVDLAPTFLAHAGLPIPGAMQGLDQGPTWAGGPAVRRAAVVENRHQPTRLHLRTYITQRYKLTVYRGETYGELFDLVQDPGERHNRWDDPAWAGVKAELLAEALQQELAREPTRMPRIAGA